MIRALLAGVARLIAGASVRRVALPSASKQRVYYANHSSHLDFILIWSALPRAERDRTRPVAGADYWTRGRIRRYLAARVFRAILIERGGGSATDTAQRSIEQITQGMGNDASIIVFPEGTRSHDGTLLPFKSGLYHLCRMKPTLELIPVYLDNMTRILPKGEVLPVPLLSRITFGGPMHFMEGETKAEFLSRARDALLALKG